MNRKQFLWLMLAVVLLGGASLALFWQDITAYRDSGAKIGARLMPDMKISDVAKLRLQDAEQEVTLALKDKVWRVEQRGGPDAVVRMSNSANYALKAFRSGGRATVDNAMRRAANNMRKYAERQTGLKFAERNVA